jgi:phosphate transport system substrate-binding protein
LRDYHSTYLASITSGLKTASEQAHAIPGVFVGITDYDAATLIERTEGSFGVTNSVFTAAERKNIKALSIDGISPTITNVSSGKYPYALLMSVLYSQHNRKAALKEFIEFLFSAAGQKIISAYGQVPVPRITG